MVRERWLSAGRGVPRRQSGVGVRLGRPILEKLPLALLLSAVTTSHACGGKLGIGDGDDGTSEGSAGGSTAGAGAAGAVAFPDGAASNAIVPRADVNLDSLVDVHDVILSGAGRLLSDEERAAVVEAACAGLLAESEMLDVELFYLVSASRSMLEPVASSGGETKWEVVRRAFASAFENMPDSAWVHLLGYPGLELESSESRTAACVDSGPLSGSGRLVDVRDTLLLSLDEQLFSACTPAADAIAIAAERLAAEPYSSVRHLVWLSDGAPTMGRNCERYATDCSERLDGAAAGLEVKAAVSTARRDASISSAIVALPGSWESGPGGGDAAWLSEIAAAGGTAPLDCSSQGPHFCHLDLTEVTSAADLEASLIELISSGARMPLPVGCALPFSFVWGDGEGLDRSNILVLVSSSTGGTIALRENRAEPCAHGWQVQGESIVICPASCEALGGMWPGAKDLSVFVGCAE